MWNDLPIIWRMPKVSRVLEKCLTAFGIVLACLALGGCGATGQIPISLPPPFSGNFDGNTNILVAQGAPAAKNASVLAWDLFDASAGTTEGQLSFFLDTMSPAEVTPFGEGVKRVYTLSACTTSTDGEEICSNNFKCLEYPTDQVATFDASTVVSGDPGAKAVVRKAWCSGNNNLSGELIDAKLVMGMVELSGGDFKFFSQEASAIYLHGISPFAKASVPDDRVVFSIVMEGFSAPLPSGDQDRSFPLYFPGSEEVVGTDVHRFTSFTALAPGLFEALAEVEFFVGESHVVIHNTRALLNGAPEVDDVFKESIVANLADDPNFSSAAVENGSTFFTTITEAEPINCDPVANEATGIFRDLCDQYGALDVQFRCSLLLDANSLTIVPMESLWVFLRP